MLFTLQVKLIRTIRLWVFLVLCSITYYLLKHKEILVFHRNKRSNVHQAIHDEEVEYFRTLWSLQRERRFNYTSIIEPCKNDMKWKPYYPERNASLITSAKTSKVTLDIRKTGQYSRVLIHAYSLLSTPKYIGGDTWRIFIRGVASMPVTLIDHMNGTYEAFFLITTPGEYFVELHLEYTLCDGYKDPPDGWFIRGNEQGKGQPDDMLPGHEKAYLEEKYDGDLSFVVISGQRNIFKELSPLLESGHPTCLMWDGFGEWNGQLEWSPLFKNPFLRSSSQKRQEGSGVFWIYGDSVGDFFYRAVWNTPLCKIIFKTCKRTYNWVYNLPHNVPPYQTSNALPYDHRDFDIQRLLHEIALVLSHPPMGGESAFLLNLGLHYVMGIQANQFIELIERLSEMIVRYRKEKIYNGSIIWKTTTALQKWKYGSPETNARHAKSHRFLTQQRVDLFNAISTRILCQAGIPVLDVFPMSFSYPNGTGTLSKPWDAVHYSRQAFVPVEEYLSSYFQMKM